MSKFPKTVAAVQKRDRCMWEIGDALLAECGAPPTDGVKDGTNERIGRVVEELEHLKLTDYSVLTLRNIRLVAFKFPKGSRVESLSWSAHGSSGSPEMLQTIVKAVGSKAPITNAVARSMRAVIEDQQEREYKKENPGKPLPKRGEMPAPSAKQVRGLALEAESLRYTNKILGCRSEMDDVAEWLEKNLDKLSAIAVDYLVETALSLAEDARRVADVARKLKASRRAHLSVVGE